MALLVWIGLGRISNWIQASNMLKLKGLNKGNAKVKKKMSAASFESDDEQEPDFQAVMAAKLKKISKQVSEKDDYIDNTVPAEKARTKRPGETVERILEAKRIRDEEHAVVQQQRKETEMQQYLNENAGAIVFSSKEFEHQQHLLKSTPVATEEEEEKGAPSFYARLIDARTGNDTLNQPLSNPSAIAAHTPPIENDKSANDGDLKSPLVQKVLQYIKSKITENDILELQKKYWQRKQSIN